MRNGLIFMVALLAVLVTADSASTREFRSISAIPRATLMPDGATPVREIVPIKRKDVDRAVRDLTSSWNSPQLSNNLGDDFYDRTRLSDNIASLLPRDASLRVLSLQSQQTIGQYVMNGKRVSRLSVTVQTQIEFNDPVQGFRRFPGTVEMVVSVEEDLKT